MNAIEYVQEFGWDETSEIINDSPLSWCFACVDLKKMEIVRSYPSHEEFVTVGDLEKLVGSWEFVKSNGGLHGAKNTLKLLESSLELGLYHGLDGINAETEIPKLKKAIADVESVESLKEVT